MGAGRAEKLAAKAEKRAARRGRRGGLVVGVVAGVVLGLLVAPKSGRETRALLFGAFSRCEYPQHHEYARFNVGVLDIIRDTLLPV